MVEQTLKGTPSGSSAGQGAKSQAQSLRGATEQAVGAGREIKDKVGDIAGSTGESIKHQASEFADAAKDFAAQASDRIKERVADQAGMGADFVGNFAETMRRAAREFDTELPIAATFIRKAASQVESVSDSVRNGDLQDLVAGAQSFARRQPTAFLGLAVLAGFGAVRFLKSSAGNENQSRHHATDTTDFKEGRSHERQQRPFDS
uniref:Late embryogenesis abundant protein n=1 Tax=Rhodopseudomonas palustris (strain BisA53) TaxID=316055 RepID=Q07HQ7_RHOP5